MYIHITYLSLIYTYDSSKAAALYSMKNVTK